MDRKTIDAILETVEEMVRQVYVEPLSQFLDHLLYELISTGAVKPASLDVRLTTVARGLDLSTDGAHLLLRARGVCRLAAKGKLPAGLLRDASHKGGNLQEQSKKKAISGSARRSGLGKKKKS